ncbi:hypothetical protein FE257_003650 [Aspergillus nanangensis]|uniref:Amine oxidase domain-containing protein n=1 Tax=Aspergillus nanangensis TaxID=2582783 RepID=A0AAD4CS00_ASPNN|nr:hypothetical protein FE257_003650 [Aspergillus nanangensis]
MAFGLLLAVQLLVIWLVNIHVLSSPVQDVPNIPEIDQIHSDVCIIGGGSAGTYAAIRLRQMGKTVVVIEKESLLGGHTNTYIDAGTGIPVDYGVIVFHNDAIVKNYFAHFKVPLAPLSLSDRGGTNQIAVDFRTGNLVNISIPGNATAALERYVGELAKYPYLTKGFDLPDPVPEDLLLPFGEFVRKYDLGAAVPAITAITQGIGDPLRQPTIYLMKYFNLGAVESYRTNFLTTAHHNNSALYDAARNELGKDVFLNSNISKMCRNSNDSMNRVRICTPGGLKTIRASKILIAIPQKLENLEGFDLDATERALFAQFHNTQYYTTLVKHTGIPEGLQISNQAADMPYGLPSLPGAYVITPTAVSGLVNIFYGSASEMSSEQVKEDIIATVLRLHNANISTTPPDFVAFKDHSPFELTVPAKAIANGFYRRLNSIQGHRKTWHTGAAFQAHDSTDIWKFTEDVVRAMFK